MQSLGSAMILLGLAMTLLPPHGRAQIIQRTRMIRRNPKHFAEISLRLGILPLVEKIRGLLEVNRCNKRIRDVCADSAPARFHLRHATIQPWAILLFLRRNAQSRASTARSS